MNVSHDGYSALCVHLLFLLLLLLCSSLYPITVSSYCPGMIQLFTLVLCRLLESELSRLRHRDPVRSCELPEGDILYHHEGTIYHSLYDISRRA